MSTARWNDQRVRHGSCRQQTAFAIERYGHAAVGGVSRASMKSCSTDRDSRSFETRISVLRQSAAKLRRRKVKALRRQIKEGSYDVDWRLATILDKMVEDLVAQANENGSPSSSHPKAGANR